MNVASHVTRIQFSIKLLSLLVACVAAWFAAIAYGGRVAGATGMLIAGISFGISIVLLTLAAWCLLNREFAFSVICLLILAGSVNFSCHFLRLHEPFSVPDGRLSHTLKKIEVYLAKNASYKNVVAKIDREAKGGCIVLTGAALSRTELDRLDRYCCSADCCPIENRIKLDATRY